MEKNYERQNEQLRRNIELLEQGITVKKYLQIENDIEVEGSTAIYNYFGIFIIYSESEKRFILYVEDATNKQRKNEIIIMS